MSGTNRPFKTFKDGWLKERRDFRRRDGRMMMRLTFELSSGAVRSLVMEAIR